MLQFKNEAVYLQPIKTNNEKDQLIFLVVAQLTTQLSRRRSLLLCKMRK